MWREQAGGAPEQWGIRLRCAQPAAETPSARIPRSARREDGGEGFQNAGSCCGSVVFVDQSAESVATLDFSACGCRKFGVARKPRHSRMTVRVLAAHTAKRAQFSGRSSPRGGLFWPNRELVLLEPQRPRTTSGSTRPPSQGRDSPGGSEPAASAASACALGARARGSRPR
jgi:hypothetical protein